APLLALAGRIGLGVALHVERLRGARALERARLPELAEIDAELAPDAGPQARRVLLERGPAHVAVDPARERYEQAAHADVEPGRVGAQRARAPDAKAASRQGAQAVHALRIEARLQVRPDRKLQIEDTDQRLVRGRLEDARARVATREDARHMPARRHQPASGRAGRRHLDPRVVERRVRGLRAAEREAPLP